MHRFPPYSLDVLPPPSFCIISLRHFMPPIFLPFINTYTIPTAFFSISSSLSLLLSPDKVNGGGRQARTLSPHLEVCKQIELKQEKVPRI
jgi:hypothetical protein